MGLAIGLYYLPWVIGLQYYGWIWRRKNARVSIILTQFVHSVRRRPSKIVPRQTQAKFLFRDDQSYYLTINLKVFSLFSIVKCPKSRPENRAYFIKAAHRRNHSRVKLATRKMFAMMHLRKKKFSNFPDSGSGLYNFRIFKIFWTLLWYRSFVVKYFLEIYYTTYFRAIGPKGQCVQQFIL